MPTTSQKVRARLAEALNLDLIGPWAGYELAEERLPGWVRPSNWYLTGFLVPSGAWPEHYTEADSDEDLDETPESGDLAEEVAAVWFWNKLKLRGGSRGSGGGERLAYYRGGFAALADALALQLPADRHRPHYAKVKVKVRRHADGALSVWHGPRRLAKHGPKGEPAADGELAAAAQRHAERSAPDPAAAGLCASGCGRCAPFARGAKPD